jgi:ABC-2 type transport system ATP-binding protein
MRRRLDLLASLVVDPPVLFLDEPTAGLDPRSRSEIWAEVSALARDGTTVLLTTQYLEEADRLADDVVIIDSGRIIAQGSPDDLKDQIGARLDVVLLDRADLSRACQVLDRWATSPPRLGSEDLAFSGDLPGTGDPLDVAERRLTTSVAAGAVTLPELVRQLDAAGVRIEDAGVRRPTLDEVFLDRIGKNAKGISA